MKVTVILFTFAATAFAAPTQNTTSLTMRDSDNTTATSSTPGLIPRNLNLNETITTRILPRDNFNDTRATRAIQSQMASPPSTSPPSPQHMQRVNETMAAMGRTANQTAMVEAMADMNKTVLAAHMARFQDKGRHVGRAQLGNETVA